MVNGPSSGGEFPLGKEYWENQAKENKGFVPKKTIKVHVDQNQHGEAAKKIKNKFSAKEIAGLIQKFSHKQQVNMDHVDVDKTETFQLNPSTEKLVNVINNIPPEDLAQLTSKKDIINYMKAHPELKQNIGLDDTKAERTEEAKPEETPQGPQPEKPAEEGAVTPEGVINGAAKAVTPEVKEDE